MEKKTLVGFALLFLAFFANFQSISSDAFDCYDACSTGCVNPDTRLMARCDRKCSIRCSADLKTSEQLGKISGLGHP
ncbi:hypothetical protein LIER_09056 [Lithospermum erythrorhizon]|uniref:Thionin-like protein n=1 Tax=Lithospermum erythrorhizon TaxID=34254 RepID=A0AAV3PED1_LITER